MGMYTECFFKGRLKSGTPDDVIQTLRYMIGDHDIKWTPAIPHPLFETARWKHCLRGSSYYFVTGGSKIWFDTIALRWFFTIHSSIKNYDGELQKFRNWIMPWIEGDEPGGFLGYTMYEEADVPDLIFAPQSQR